MIWCHKEQRMLHILKYTFIFWTQMYFRSLIWRVPWIILHTIIQYLELWVLSNSVTNGKHLAKLFVCVVKSCHVYSLPNDFQLKNIKYLNHFLKSVLTPCGNLYSLQHLIFRCDFCKVVIVTTHFSTKIKWAFICSLYAKIRACVYANVSKRWLESYLCETVCLLE